MPGGWRTSIEGSAGGAASPVQSGRGWQFYESERKEKQGWQYTLPSPDASAASPLLAELGSPQSLSVHRSSFVLLEPITFEVEFGANPRLVVSFLRSYENFGRALLWLDGNSSLAMQALAEEHAYRALCPEMTKVGMGVLCEAKSNGFVPYLTCSTAWTDSSSRTFTVGFDHGWMRTRDTSLGRRNGSGLYSWMADGVGVPGHTGPRAVPRRRACTT